MCGPAHAERERRLPVLPTLQCYRIVQAYQEGTLGLVHNEDGTLGPPVHTTVLTPARKRSLLALLKAAPRASGWCRTRWSCTTLAVTLQTKRGITISAETVRRWLHEVGWVWKRAKLVAKDNDPQRVERLARIRWVFAYLPAGEALVFADELDIPWLPKVGYAWMPKGAQVAVMTPGQVEQWLERQPLERVLGDVHDKCTRNHTRKRLRELVGDGQRHVQENGPWQDKLSQIYYDSEVAAVIKKMATTEQLEATA